MTTLTLIRHGQSIWNVIRRHQGQAPVPLTELGHKQAQYVADALAQNSLFDVFYCSDLTRCRQTAAPIAEALDMTIHYDARWREISCGSWQGLDHGQAEILDPENWAAHRADPHNVPMPGGESVAMLNARVVDVLAEVLARHPGERVLVVTHGGPINAVLGYFDLWPYRRDDPDRPSLWNTSQTVLRIENGIRKVEITQLADVSHLSTEQVT